MICRSADLSDGGRGVRFEIERDGNRLPAFAIRHGGSVRAYVNRCAHIGVELDWVPGEFFDSEGTYLVCATHGATYEAASGRCIAGPCKGRNLDPVEVVERDAGVHLIQLIP